MGTAGKPSYGDPLSVHLFIYQAALSTKDWRPPLLCPRGPQTGPGADWDLLSLREAILRGMDGKVVIPVLPGHERPQLRLFHLRPTTRASALPEMGSGCPSDRQQQTLRRGEVRAVQRMGGGLAGCLTGRPGPGAEREALSVRVSPQGRAGALEQ